MINWNDLMKFGEICRPHLYRAAATPTAFDVADVTARRATNRRPSLAASSCQPVVEWLLLASGSSHAAAAADNDDDDDGENGERITIDDMLRTTER